MTTRTAKHKDCERNHSQMTWRATDDLHGTDDRMASYCNVCEGVFLEPAKADIQGVLA